MAATQQADGAAVVAPHGGAWIEIALEQGVRSYATVAPHGGAWIEIRRRTLPNEHARVAPHGGAWIEICTSVIYCSFLPSPLTEGRGLKWSAGRRSAADRRSPLTEGRGLKSHQSPEHAYPHRVAPHGGAWIEIEQLVKILLEKIRSPLTEGRGLK